MVASSAGAAFELPGQPLHLHTALEADPSSIGMRQQHPVPEPQVPAFFTDRGRQLSVLWILELSSEFLVEMAVVMVFSLSMSLSFVDDFSSKRTVPIGADELG